MKTVAGAAPVADKIGWTACGGISPPPMAVNA